MDTPLFTPTLRGRTLIRFLTNIALGLVVLHLIAMVTRYGFSHPRFTRAALLFDLDAEQNFPTYFSSFLLMLAAVSLALIASLERSGSRSPWVILSTGFVCMSLEEFIGFHEILNGFIRNASGVRQGVFAFAWVFPAAFLVLIIGLVLLRFFLQLPSKTRFLFGISAVIYLSGTIGCEMLGSLFYQPDVVLQNMGYMWSSTLEESLEMFGVILFIHAQIQYLEKRFGPVQVRISS